MPTITLSTSQYQALISCLRNPPADRLFREELILEIEHTLRTQKEEDSDRLARQIFSQETQIDQDLDANILVEELRKLEESASTLPNAVLAGYIEEFQDLVSDWTKELHRRLDLGQP